MSIFILPPVLNVLLLANMHPFFLSSRNHLNLYFSELFYLTAQILLPPWNLHGRIKFTISFNGRVGIKPGDLTFDTYLPARGFLISKNAIVDYFDPLS